MDPSALDAQKTPEGGACVAMLCLCSPLAISVTELVLPRAFFIASSECSRLVWFSCCSYCDKETPDREHESGCFAVDLAWEPKGLDFGQETVELISSAPRRRQSEFAVA